MIFWGGGGLKSLTPNVCFLGTNRGAFAIPLFGVLQYVLDATHSMLCPVFLSLRSWEIDSVQYSACAGRNVLVSLGIICRPSGMSKLK